MVLFEVQIQHAVELYVLLNVCVACDGYDDY